MAARCASGILLTILTCLAAAEPTAVVGWRGDGSGVFPGQQVPATWSATENVRWRVDLPNWSNSSPIVADGRVYLTCEPTAWAPWLLCFDAASGKPRWKTLLRKDGENARGRKGPRPQGYGGHMGPGGSPVLLRIGEVRTLITAHGAVIRVQDGKLLGQVELPSPRSGNRYGASYTAWVPGADGVIYASQMGYLATWAVRLELRGDALAQTLLWTDAAAEKGDGGYPQALWQGRLHTTAGTALDPATGKILSRNRACVVQGYTQGNTHSLALGGGTVVVVNGGLQGNGNQRNRLVSYSLAAAADLSLRGRGCIAEAQPTGEVLERHRALLGYGHVHFGHATATLWGNRIFIRSNDYLYCFGDPRQPFRWPSSLP